MGLIRVIVFGLAIWLVYKFYQAYVARVASFDKQEKPTGTMIKCSECNTYIPKDKAISSGAQWFCCRAHQKDFEQKNNSDQRD
jgi:uncharacterized paraquat-inducible protein A